MTRKPNNKKAPYTNPDHRPMIPVLRRPSDPVDAAIRDARRCDELINPKEFLNWR